MAHASLLIAKSSSSVGWPVGLLAVVNYKGIQAIINRVINWEKRSGVIFKGKKTILVHFTKNVERTNTTPFIIKGKTVILKHTAKILGVVIDAELWYK